MTKVFSVMTKRIPQNFIDELLTRVDIVQVVERHLTLKKAGSNYSALCPFHQEKSPSFTVSPSKQFYYCFGCGAKGNAIGFVMNYEHLGFVDAIEQLAQLAGMQMPTEFETQSSIDHGHQHLFAILEKAASFYHAQLRKHPMADKAKAYLKKRGLNAEVVEQFMLGFAPLGWDNLMKYLSAGQHKENDNYLLQAGLVVENEQGKRYDRFRDRIIFPIRDRRGRVIGFGGRVLDDSTPKYLNSPETPLFHKGQELYGLYEARQKNDLQQIIVVEGYMDVIALHQQGVSGVVATLGTAITAQHIQRLARVCKNIIFCFDGDAAGRRAAWKALEVTLPALTDDLAPRFLFLPPEHDPDSFIRQEGKEVFLRKLDQAMPLADFLLESLSEVVNLETVAGRSQLIASVLPYLQKIKAPVTKELLIEMVAKLTRTDLDKLREWVESGEMEVSVPRKDIPRHKPVQAQTPVRMAITLILQSPSVLQQVMPEWPDADLPGLKLLKEITALVNSQPNISTGALLEHWRDKSEFEPLSKLAAVELLVPEEGLASELQDCIWRIKLEVCEARIVALMEKAGHSGLSQEERQKLQQFLQDKQKIFSAAREQN